MSTDDGPPRAPQVPPRGRGPARVAVVLLFSTLLPVLFGLVVLGPASNNASVRPTSAFLVLVLAATVVAGIRAGAICFVISFVMLFVVIYQPRNRVQLDSTNDAVSIAIFTVTSGIVLMVVSRLRNDRIRAREALRLQLEAEQDLLRAADRAHVMRLVAERVATEARVADVAWAVVDQSGDGIGADGAALYLYDDEGQELVVEAYSGFAESDMADWMRVRLADDTPLAGAVRDRRAFFRSEREPAEPAVPAEPVEPAEPVVPVDGGPATRRDLSFGARCALPLFEADGGVIGGLVLAWHDRHEFDTSEQVHMLTLASVAESALERALLTERQERNRFAAALEAMIDPVAIYSPVRDRTGRIVDFRVDYTNEAGRESLFGFLTGGSAVGRGLTELFGGRVPPERIETYGRVVEEQESTRLRGVRIELPDGDVRHLDVNAAPFGTDGLILSTRDVTERERFLEQLAASDARLRAAQRVGRTGSWETDVTTGQTVWSEEMYRMYGLDPGIEVDLVEVVRSALRPEEAERLRSIVVNVVETGLPMDTEYAIRREDGVIRQFRSRAEVAPGPSGPVVRGVVQDVTDERALRTAVASLRSNLRDERAAVEVLQRALLPQELPAVPFARVHAVYRPAGSASLVGGDWFDAFALPDGRLGFTVGDVAGHGMGAAAAMSELRHSLRAYVRSASVPAETLSLLDGLYAATGEEPYATCFFAVLDGATSKVTWANAGHLPMLRRREGRSELLETRPGAPLGTGVGSFHEESVSMQPGDVLVLYTDGLVERRGTPLADGLDLLRTTAERLPTLPVADLCERLTDLMLEDMEHEDDVCVLAVEVLGGEVRPVTMPGDGRVEA